VNVSDDFDAHCIMRRDGRGAKKYPQYVNNSVIALFQEAQAHNEIRIYEYESMFI
jgi:hypothetical protein